jgi:hypothetical protein
MMPPTSAFSPGSAGSSERETASIHLRIGVRLLPRHPRQADRTSSTQGRSGTWSSSRDAYTGTGASTYSSTGATETFETFGEATWSRGCRSITTPFCYNSWTSSSCSHSRRACDRIDA